MHDDFTLAAVTSDLTRTADADEANAVEFRMDHATDPLAQLESYDGSLPIIATNRVLDEGGNAKGPDRLPTLAAAAEYDSVTAVDVELDAVEAAEADEVLDTCAETDTVVIVSWHDFDGTPAEATLERRLRTAATHGSIAKVAVTANTLGDVLSLLTVTHRLTEAGVDVATMSMGDAGRHSRIIAPLYGSRIGYAPIDPAEATAPGQFDLATMADLLDTIR